MGGQTSKSTSVSQSVQNTLTKVAVKASQECRGSSTNIQKLNISDIKTRNCNVKISGVSQDAYIVSNLSCVNDQKLATDIQNKLKEQLDQETKAATEGLGGFFSQSESTGIKQSVKNVMNEINTTLMSSCIKEDYASQALNISDIEMDCSNMKDGELNIADISQAMMAKSVAKCLNDQTNAAEALNEVEEKIEQAQDTSIKGMTFAGGGGVSSSLSSCVLCISIIMILVIMGSGGGGGE